MRRIPDISTSPGILYGRNGLSGWAKVRWQRLVDYIVHLSMSGAIGRRFRYQRLRSDDSLPSGGSYAKSGDENTSVGVLGYEELGIVLPRMA